MAIRRAKTPTWGPKAAISTGPGVGGRELYRSINTRRSGKDCAGVGGEGSGIVLLAGADGGGAVGLGVVGGK